MARINLNDADKYSGGGNLFFKLSDGETKNVRFLYNTIEEVETSAMTVHEYKGEKFATIDCARVDGDPIDMCKWCREGNQGVVRVVLPMYIEGENVIQYWTKSYTFVRDVLLPAFRNLPVGKPICSQVFSVSRTGNDWKNTKYSAVPNLQIPANDKLKDAYGEIKDPFEAGIIKPNDFTFDTQNNTQQNAQQQYQPRRTADVFGV